MNSPTYEKTAEQKIEQKIEQEKPENESEIKQKVEQRNVFKENERVEKQGKRGEEIQKETANRAPRTAKIATVLVLALLVSITFATLAHSDNLEDTLNGLATQLTDNKTNITETSLNIESNNTLVEEIISEIQTTNNTTNETELMENATLDETNNTPPVEYIQEQQSLDDALNNLFEALTDKATSNTNNTNQNNTNESRSIETINQNVNETISEATINQTQQTNQTTNETIQTTTNETPQINQTNQTNNETINLTTIDVPEIPINENETKQEITDAEGKTVDTNITISEDSVTISFNEGPVKEMLLIDVANETALPRVDQVPKTIPLPSEIDKEENNWAQIYAIDPTNTTFNKGLVEVVARGTSLYKCKEWNFDERTCNGNWQLLGNNMVPGKTYYIMIDQLDPAFGEIIAVEAYHLDSEYNIISDIYANISAIDNVWSEPIPEGHFVRVKFEHNLENGNVIDFLARDNGTVSFVEVYVANTSILVGRSGVAGIPELQYVTVSGLPEPTDMFDLKVVKHVVDVDDSNCEEADCNANTHYENSLDGFIEFDFIHDALINGTVADGLVVYVEGAVTTPRYRIWNGSGNTIGAELSANDIGADGRWTVLKANPKRDEFIFGVLDASTNTSAQIWNGTAWSSVQVLASDSPNIARRSFDVAYEHTSGTGLIVYENSTAVDNQVAYRTWDGVSWSSQGTLTTNASTVHWIKTVPRTGSNDIMVLLHDVNNDLFGILWNGTGFDNSTQFSITASINDIAEQSFDFIWMGTSGNGLVVYSNSTTAYAHRTYTSSNKSWSSSSNFLTLNSGAPNGMRLCADPTSNYAGFVSQDTTADGNFLIWNGTGVETSPVPPAEETDMEANGAGAIAMDCAFESVSGNAVFMYTDGPAGEDNQFKICTYNKTAWSNASMTDCPITSTVISGAASMESFKLYPSPVNNSIFVLAQNVLEDLGVGLYNGSTVTNASVVETSLECLNGENQCVDFAWVRASAEPAISSPANQTVELGDDSTLTWNLNGSGGTYYVLRNGSLFVPVSSWSSGVDIVISPFNYVLGLWNYTLVYTDTLSNSFSSSAFVNVVDNVNPSCDELGSGSGSGSGGGLTLASITIDGNLSDWAGVLNNQNNFIGDLTVLTGDPDSISTNDRDMIRSAFTYDNSTLYFYTKRTTRGSRQMSYIIYLDYDLDSKMESTDRVVKFVWSGTTQQFDSDLYNYVPVNGSGDIMGGDGVEMPGSITLNTSLETNVPGGSSIGTELETRVTWSALGLSGPTLLNFKAASGLGSSTNLPSQLEDNVGEVYALNSSALLFRPDNEKPAKNGTSVYYDHDIMNCGIGSELIDLTNVSSQGWNVTLYYPNGSLIVDTDSDGLPNLNLSASQYQIIVVKIDVPANTTSGTVDITNITANYSGGNESVIDTTSVSDIAISPENRFAFGSAGMIAIFNYTVYNLQSFSDTILINATSSNNWTITLRYPNGTLISGSLGLLAPNAVVNISVYVTVPENATIGQTDNTTIRINSSVVPGRSDNSTANITVRQRLILEPDYNRTVTVNVTEFYAVNITNNWNETDEIDLSYVSLLNWSVSFLADDLVTSINSINVSGFGGVETIYVTITAPTNVTFGVSDITNVTGTSSLNTSVSDSVVINSTPRGVLIYNDSALTILDNVFEVYYPGDNTTAFAKGFFLNGITNVSFGWYDSNGTLVRLSPNISVSVDGTANDSLNMNTTSFLGFWTVIIYNSSDYSEVVRTEYLLRDIIVPNVTNVLPINGSAVSVSSTVNITANVTDNVAVDTVVANVTFPNGSSTLVTMNLSSGTIYSGSFVVPVNGTYNVTILANDTSNNLNNSETTSFIASVGFANIVVSKTDSPDPVVKGTQLNYTILLSNNGTADATNVSLVELYPSGVTFHNASPAPTSGNNTWVIALIAANSSTTVNIIVNVSSSLSNGTILNNSVNATFVNSTVNVTVNDSEFTTVLGFPVIITNKTDSPDPAQKGSQLNYNILIDNVGDDTAYNVSVVEIYPTGVIFHNSSPAPTTGNNTWNLGNLTNGTNFTINITVNVSDALSNGTILSNAYNLTYVNITQQVNQTINATNTTIRGQAVIQTTKTSTPNPAQKGTPLVYQINITNNGDDTANNITVIETYPTGVTFHNSTPSPTTGNNTWDIGNLTPGGTYQINITVNVSDTLTNGTTLGNNYNITFANFNGTNTTTTNNTNTTIRGQAVIQTTKTSTPNPAQKGTPLVYQINITNNGDDTANNITVIETYPTGVTFHNSTPSPTTGNNTWDIGNLSNGSMFQINITLNISDSLTNGTILGNNYNITFANFNGTNTTTTNNTNTTIRGTPIVNVTKTSEPDPVRANTTLFYQINITNNGDDTAFNVTLLENYPSDVTFVNASPAPTTGNNTWIFGSLLPNATTQVNITLNVSATKVSGTIGNNITVNYTTFFNETNTTNITEETTVEPFGVPNITITKTSTPEPVVKGNQLVYQLNLTNIGNDTAINVTVVENYPLGVVFHNSTPSPTTGNGTWFLGNITAGGIAQINITLNVSSSLSNGTIINNTATAYYNQTNGTSFNQTTNNTPSTVRGFAVIDTTKTDSPDPALNGSTITYQINITNNGDDTAHNITVMDSYPSGVTFHNSSPSPTTGNNTWDIGNLTPGGTYQINITVNVSVATTTTLINTYNVTYANYTGANTTITNSTSTLVALEAELVVDKIDSPDPIGRGRQLTYNITITNPAGTSADNITVIETYPSGVTFHNSSPSPTTGNNTWDIGNLSAGNTTYIIIVVNVSDTLVNGTILNNTVNTTFAQLNGSTVLVVATENTTVRGSSIVLTTKTDLPDPITKGNQLTYQINITNNGDDAAYNTTLVDTYPSGVTFHNSSPSPTTGNNTWNIGNLSNGTNYQINITVNVSLSVVNGTTLNNSYNISYVNYTNEQGIIVNSTTTTVQGYPEIATSKTSSPNPIIKGNLVAYQINITNFGDDVAYNITVNENYSTGVTFINASPNPTTGNNSWDVGNLSNGSMFQINITLNVSDSLANGTTLGNNYNVTFANTTGQNTTITNSTNTTVYGTAILNITKESSPNPVARGELLTYNITINNTGDDTAFNTTLVESYPTGVTFINSSPSPTTGNNTWSLGNLSNGTSTTVIITLNVSSALTNGTNLGNFINVTFTDRTGENTTRNVSENTTVAGFASLITTKTSTPNPVTRGDQLTYQINITNNGDDVAYNITVIETYPNATTFHTSSPAPSVGNNTWNVGNLTNGTSYQINITLNVSRTATNGTILGNIYNVSWQNSTGGTLNVTNSTNTTVQGYPEITTSKTLNESPAPAGNVLTYQINISNIGDEVAYNISVIETYPANVTFINSTPSPTTGNNTWLLGNLTNGSNTQINITINISATAGNGTILNNSYTVTFANTTGQNTTVTNTTNTTVIPDNRPPMVFILNPLNGSQYYLNETFTIIANVTDNLDDVDTVIFTITFPDGTVRNYSTGVNGTLYSFNWTNMTQRGVHNITVFANDSVNNINYTESVVWHRIPLHIIDVVDREGVQRNFTVAVVSNSSGLLNLTVDIYDSRVKQMNITVHDEEAPLSIMRVDDPELQSDTAYFAEYAIDPQDFNFTNATVMVTSVSGGTLYTCKDYNFSAGECNNASSWVEVMNLTKGENYYLNISPGDPGFLETSPAVDVALAPINETTFVIAFVDNNESDVSFRIMNTNGSTIVNTTDVDDTVDGTSRVSVAMKNTTHFVISWIDGVDDDARYQIYHINGTNTTPAVTVDADVGINADISVTELGDRFVVCYADDSDNDANFASYFNNGTIAVTEVDADTNIAPGATLQNLVSCAAINGTRFTYMYYDDADNDASYAVFNETGGVTLGETDLDGAVGETGQVATATLNNERIAQVFYDSADQDITISVVFPNGTTILAPTDIDTAAGAISRVAIGVVRRNTTATEDLFVPVWFDNASNDIKAAVYNSTGDQVTAPFTVDSQPDETFRLLHVTGRDPITNNTICPGRFVVGFSNNTEQGIFTGFFTNGTVWNGFCDNDPPLVFDLRPVANSTYEVLQTIEIAANVTDDTNITSVFATIFFPNGTQQNLTLVNVNGTDKYNASFDIGLLTGLYNVTFTAFDSQGNVNNTERTNFTVIVTTPVIVVDKTDSPDPIVRGNQLNYIINVSNQGNGTAYNVSAVETYPSGVTFHNSSPVPSSGNNTWLLGNITAGNSTTINITVNVSQLLANGTILNNTVNATYANLTGTNFSTIEIENTTVISDNAPFVQLIAPANATNTTNTTLNFIYNATDDESTTMNCTLFINSTANTTNSTVLNNTISTFTVTNFAEGRYNWNVACTDGSNNTNTSETRNFTVDLTPPDFNSLVYTPSDNDSLDPGVQINFTANVTDNLTLVHTVIFHVLLNNVSIQNITMTPNGTNLYNVSYTPLLAGNYTFFLTANDTVGNLGTSTSINITIEFESTWTRSPTSFGAVPLTLGANATLGILTVNNTGDTNLTFGINSTFNATFFNETNFTLAPGETRLIQVNVTAPSTFGAFPINITINASPNATPTSQITTATIVITDNAFLFANFTIIPTQVTQGQSGIAIEATVRNIGVLNASNVTLNITLPSDWILTGGTLGAFFSDLEVNASESLSITVEIPSNAITGLRDVLTFTNGVNSTGANLHAAGLVINTTAQVLVVASTPPFGNAGGGGGGGGTGGGAGGATGGGGYRPGPAINKTYETPVINSEDWITVIRGAKIGFPIEIYNAYQNAIMTDVTLRIEGIQQRYVSWQPDKLENLFYGNTKEFFITLEGPAYLDKTELELLLEITATLETPTVVIRNGVAYAETERKKIIEYKTVHLAIKEYSPEELKSITDELRELYSRVVTLEYPHSLADHVLLQIEDSINKDKLGLVPYLAATLKDLLLDTLDSGESIEQLKQRLTDAEYRGLDAEEGQLLLNFALKAFQREQFDLAEQRALEGLDINYLETKRAFNIWNFIYRYWWALLLATAAGAYLTARAMQLMALYYIRNKLDAYTKEQLALQRAMREAQEEAFVKKTLSSLEYFNSMNQYEKRLDVIKSEIAKLRVMRAKVLSLDKAIEYTRKEQEHARNELKKAQTQYFVDGQVSRKTYTNRAEEIHLLLEELDTTILELMARKK